MLLHQNDRDVRVGSADPCFRSDVFKGLAGTPRSIPPRWFYDLTGSKLFEAITMLPGYYLGRSEQALLCESVNDISLMMGKRVLVEFGSGSSAKAQILLGKANPYAYVPIDISRDYLWESAERVAYRFPHLPIYPIEGDFTRPLDLPASAQGLPMLGFFSGSTIGNLVIADAVELLQNTRSMLGENAMLLLGIDQNKDPRSLLPAYDDPQGVTATFNLNLLHRINRQLDGTIPVSKFRHVVCWNEAEACIEMYLEALCDLEFKIDRQQFAMQGGERILTEHSRKYGPEAINRLLQDGGWMQIAKWTDSKARCTLILAIEAPTTSADPVVTKDGARGSVCYPPDSGVQGAVRSIP